MTVWLPVVGMLGLAALLLRAGLRGRRIGTEPFCRKCEYQLTGIQSARCPECGSELNDRAIVHGVRKRRWGLVTLAVVLPLVFPPNWTFVAQVRSNWYGLLPLRVLRELVDRGSLRAGSELQRRVNGAELTQEELKGLYGHSCTVLRRQLAPLARSNWRTFVQLLLSRRALTESELRLSFPEYTQVQMRVRPSIRAGDPLPLHLLWTPKHPGIDFVRCSLERSALWSRENVVLAYFPRDGSETVIPPALARPLEYYSPRLYPQLAEGAHELKYIGVNVMHSAFGSFSTEGSDVARVDVLPRDAPDPVRWIEAPEMDAGIRAAINVGSGCMKPEHAIVHRHHGKWRCLNWPLFIELEVPVVVPLAFQVKIETEGTVYDLTHQPSFVKPPFLPLPAWPSGQTGKWCGNWHLYDQRNAEVYVILEGSKDVARQTLDMFEVWNGTIRLGPFQIGDHTQMEDIDDDMSD